MRYEYRFPELPELKDTSIWVENRGKRLRTKVEGKCPLWLRVIRRWYFDMFSFTKPIVQSPDGNFYSLYLPPIPSPAHARMFSSTISSIYFKRPLPLAVTIGVTTDCQYLCAHCSAAGRSESASILSLDELKRVVRECLDLGVSNITFTGGEPLLRSDLEECVACVPSELATSQVFTNGLALTINRARSLKEAGLHGVQISLDSPSPEEHDRLRGMTGAFKAVKEGVKNALDAGLYVGVSTYATKRVALDHTLVKIVELCHEWGAHEVSVFDAISTGRLRDQEVELLDAPSRKVLLKDAKDMNRRYRGKLRVVTQTWTNSGHGLSKVIGCLAAHMQFHVTAQGDFAPCDFTPLSIGNVREKSVAEIWRLLLKHPAYCKRSMNCRMQDPDFRKKYIDTIPEGADLPYPIELLESEKRPQSNS